MPFDAKNNISQSDVSRETFEHVLEIYSSHENIYHKLIDKWLTWNRSVNLFSRNTNHVSFIYHIQHSLFLLPLLDTNKNKTIIDVGTGGGLPGLPLAIADSHNHYLLVDKVRKKYFALKDIIRSLDIHNATPIHNNIQQLQIEHDVCVVSKHTFSLGELINGLQHCNWAELHLLKGNNVFSEITHDHVKQFDFTLRKIIYPEVPFFQNKFIVSVRRK